MPNIGPQTSQNLTLFQNRTSIITIPVLDQNGNPYPLGPPPASGAEWGMAFNAQADAVLELSTGTSGGNMTLTQGSGPLAGTWLVTIILTPAMTANIPPQNYYHEVSVFDVNGDVVNVTTGTITLLPSLVKY